jgi:hypothetical protein
MAICWAQCQILASNNLRLTQANKYSKKLNHQKNIKPYVYTKGAAATDDQPNVLGVDSPART